MTRGVEPSASCAVLSQHIGNIEDSLKVIAFAALQLLTLDLSADTVLSLRAATQADSLRTLIYIYIIYMTYMCVYNEAGINCYLNRFSLSYYYLFYTGIVKICPNAPCVLDKFSQPTKQKWFPLEKHTFL